MKGVPGAVALVAASKSSTGRKRKSRAARRREKKRKKTLSRAQMHASYKPETLSRAQMHASHKPETLSRVQMHASHKPSETTTDVTPKGSVKDDNGSVQERQPPPKTTDDPSTRHTRSAGQLGCCVGVAFRIFTVAGSKSRYCTVIKDTKRMQSFLEAIDEWGKRT